jgi:hypothetical protein
VADIAASMPQTSSEAPSPGLLARIGGILFSPRETYAAVVARPKWLGVMLVTLPIAAACYYVILSSPDMQDAIIDGQLRAMASRGATVPDQAITQMETGIAYLPIIYAVAIPIIGPIFSAICAGVLLLVFSTLMGGTGTFRQVFAVVAHSGVVSTLAGIFSAALVAIGAKPMGMSPPGANLGVFVPMLEEGTFLVTFLSSVDLIFVWWLVSLSIGLAVLYKRRTGGIATALIAVYVTLMLLVAFARS